MRICEYIQDEEAGTRACGAIIQVRPDELEEFYADGDRRCSGCGARIALVVRDDGLQPGPGATEDMVNAGQDA